MLDDAVSRHSEHLMSRTLQALEELTGLLELLRPGALREVAADDDEVGLELIDAALQGADQTLVMRAEVQVREMDEASHD